MTGEAFEPLGVGLGKLLRENKFSVPNHQRDYSWKEEHVRQLFSDIFDAAQRADPYYFIGLMVFLRGQDGGLIVLDGQQRLATAIIFLSAIRNWLRLYSEKQEDASRIQDWFIGSSELGERTPRPRIVMNAANNRAFSDYIAQAVPISDITTALSRLKRHDRSRRLLECAVYCYQIVADKVAAFENPDDAAKSLFEIVNYLRDRATVVTLFVQSEDLAFTIFETLNDRGLELSPLDLVKNFLFSRAASDAAMLTDMEDRWTQMMSTLSNVRADNFLKAFWTSRHGRIRAGQLFQTFKRQYSDVREVSGLSSEMLEASEQYAALESADDPVWAPYSEGTRNTVRSLSVAGSQQAHPVMLAALAKMEAVEVERLLRLLEVIIVRYLLIVGGNPGQFETSCAVVARKIYTSEVKTAADTLQELRELYPADDDFRRSFEIAQERSPQKAQYLLRMLEREARRREFGAAAGELQPGAVSLEHIFPKNAGSEWDAVVSADAAIKDDCTYRLGNQCLLTERMNRQAGRRHFVQKVEFYQASDLRTTNHLTQYDEWNRNTIDARQNVLATLAVQAWRFQ
jgi:hypothetical protein